MASSLPRTASASLAGGTELRADLQGMEVADSDFGLWLQAGGERRRRARTHAEDASWAAQARTQAHPVARSVPDEPDTAWDLLTPRHL